MTIQISNVKLDNKNDINAISKLIYKVFQFNNKSSSSEKLINKYELLFGAGYKYENIVYHFNKGNNIFLKASEGQKIIGIIRGNYDKIINLYVDYEQQGKGIGKKLMHSFEKISKKHGTKEIHLKSSEFANKFYKYMGYTKEDGKYLIKKLT